MKKQHILRNILASCLTMLTVFAHAQQLSDPLATAATRHLYKKLYALKDSHCIFGHQDDLAYGVQWKYKPGKSDVKDVTQDYPGLYGWDLGHIELDSSRNLDGIPFSSMKAFIREGYERGGAITISWHFRNPLTGGSAWDTTHGAVESILPGGAKHELYKSWLNKVADFIQDLKGRNGEAIPVLFRPFHELTGNWFWWCKNTCSAEAFKALWRFTADYLRKEKQLHNLVLVYNTADYLTEADFLERYPGDDAVDMVSFDMYQFTGQSRKQFIGNARHELKILCDVAKKKNKIAAFAETGYEAIPDAQWWTKALMPVLQGYPISYVLVWRNAGYMESMKKMHYYAPYPKQVSAADFRRMYNSGKFLFGKGIRNKKIYQP